MAFSLKSSETEKVVIRYFVKHLLFKQKYFAYQEFFSFKIKWIFTSISREY
jgi:hypothetical protein